MRPKGLYGRKPALIPASLRDLTYYTAGHLPKPPSKTAVPVVMPPGDGTLWGMDGNDTYGDCGVAGLAHGMMADNSLLHSAGFTAATADQTVQYYLGYTGGQDTGVVLSDFLAYVKKTGFCGQTIDAYAPVSKSDIHSLQFAISAYGYAYVGITVTQGMEEAYQNGKPWNLGTLSSPVAGGHCIILAGYDSRYLYGVTWGGIVRIPYSTWHYIGDEAWASITGMQVASGNDGRGINLDALRADLEKLAT